MNALTDGIRFIKGIGEARAKALEKLDIYTLYDLVSYFPRDYEDRSRVKNIADVLDGEYCCVKATAVTAPVLARIRKGMELVKFRIADESGAAGVTFFNQSYVKKNVLRGGEYTFYGRFSRVGQHIELTNPVYEKAESGAVNTGRIVPVYRLTAGISRNVLSNAIEQGLKAADGLLKGVLPEYIEGKYGFISSRQAYHAIHFPKDMAEASRARQRLIFEELFTLACALGSMKGRNSDRSGVTVPMPDVGEFYSSLPYELTGAQKRAVNDILSDMASGRAMNRLVQGDVGSGKTVVAAAAVWAVRLAGHQSAFMAPTELLADQHYNTFTRLLEPLGVKTVLLKGSMTAKQKNEIKGLIALGEADLIIGTHALLGENVVFSDLALAVTDEQHRFGVKQRAALSEKSGEAHVLVMSATPIPRTLALIIYGDLDVTVIDELPPGRKKVDTFAVGEDKRERLNGFIRKTVGEGRQVYIVCPMIEENDDLSLHSAEEHYEQLRDEVFPDLRVALLHGKMKASEKTEVMRAFAEGKTDILVSTTVIEVGVDVPNAVLMVVENAERFGLSQLHQLRGRVGRGAEKSYCILMRGGRGAESDERLSAMTRLSDGFKLSEEDLRLRGPGDFFGSRQHGMPEMKIASLADSLDVLSSAQEEAQSLLEKDPELKAYPELRERVNKLFEIKLN
ncbi:MAG: ATP-dependent DNA helicase RecG [Oscillospiraceae bacterium]|nr:ATP-dependent DNA helicase RecG [Oscillospiraceae bacterium]